MPVLFTRHAEDKFSVLKRHKFPISREQVLEAINTPDAIDESRLPLLIAQKSIDQTHVLRVVYRLEGNTKVIITFYPGRVLQYGQG